MSSGSFNHLMFFFSGVISWCSRQNHYTFNVFELFLWVLWQFTIESDFKEKSKLTPNIFWKINKSLSLINSIDSNTAFIWLASTCNYLQPHTDTSEYHLLKSRWDILRLFLSYAIPLFIFLPCWNWKHKLAYRSIFTITWLLYARFLSFFIFWLLEINEKYFFHLIIIIILNVVLSETGTRSYDDIHA